MSSVDAFIVREIVGRVDWAVNNISSAIARDADINDEDDDNIDRPPKVSDFEPEVMIAEFLMRARALPASTFLDDQFARLYHHLALLPKTKGFNEATLRLFAREYSIETRVARLKALKVEVTAAVHALEVARQMEDDTLTAHGWDRSIKSAEDVEWAKGAVDSALARLANVAAKGAAIYNEMVVVGRFDVYWGINRDLNCLLHVLQRSNGG